jgi:hypothetical protein
MHLFRELGDPAMNALSHSRRYGARRYWKRKPIPYEDRRAADKATIGHYTFTNSDVKMRSRI